MRPMQEIIGNVGGENLSCGIGFGISELGELLKLKVEGSGLDKEA